MAAIKMTFTFDEDTVERLAHAAERLQKSKSYVVREAIRDFAEHIGKLSERERTAMLEIFDRQIAAIPERPLSEVRAELREVRAARKRGGRGGGAS